jgi:hypothetical protein
MVIPMKGLYEHQCNAVALQLLGIPVLKNLKRKQYKKVKDWIDSDRMINMDYPDEAEYIPDQILETHCAKGGQQYLPEPDMADASKFRNLLLKKIFQGKA